MIGLVRLYVQPVAVLIVWDLDALHSAGGRVAVASHRCLGLALHAVSVISCAEPLSGRGRLNGAEQHTIA
jgi:hypothetical protein